MPSLSSFLPTVNPGAPRSTMNAVMPRYPASGFTLAKTMNTPASFPLVIHSLRPLMTKSPPSAAARVASANASLPEPASDRAYAPTVSAARRGRYRCLTSAEPHRRMALTTSVFCTSTSTPTDGSTAESASTARTEWKNRAPPPPYSSGISMPITPRPKSCSTSACGIFACSSISRASGRTWASANSATLSRSRTSSSARLVRAGCASV